ncbi:MAG: GrpB family protein [Promethearchaeota archaeon]
MSHIDPIIVVNYDPIWPVLFQKLKDALNQKIQDLPVKIEHIGSTSVPDLAAKPILDINIVIPNRDLLPTIIGRLAELGYEHNGDQGILGREAFKRASTKVPFTDPLQNWMQHHLYVCAEDARELRRQLFFRDYLLVHPKQRDAYGELKFKLAEQFWNEREMYTNAKTSFIQDILDQME